MKKLIKSLSEYRQWAFDIFDNHGPNVADSLGLLPEYDCYDYNEQNEPIDEAGNVIPEETAETIKVEDWVNELVFPLIVVHVFEKDWDRQGSFEIVFMELVELKDFQ